jgi:hypothetical protein
LAVLLFHRIADKILENKDRKIKLEEKEKICLGLNWK